MNENPRKKVKVSKNRKKSWRKHIDIDDVEGFLDQKRFEERIGHSIIDAEDDDLFVIEKTGNVSVFDHNENEIDPPKTSDSTAKQTNNENVGQSKLRTIVDGHKFFQKLQPTSKVPAIVIDRKGAVKKTIFNDDEKLKKYWKDKKHLIEKAEKLKEIKRKIAEDSKLIFYNNYDLWADDAKPDLKSDVKVPEHLRQKPSLVPAVEVPQPGQSYNPSVADYKALISQEVDKEMQMIDEEKRLAKKVDRFYVTKAEATNEKTWLDEMSQGLFDNSTDNAKEADENESFGPSKITKKKTKSQKNRELREKLAKKKKEQEKRIRIKENQVFRIKTFAKEIKEQEQKAAERAKIRQSKRLESLYKPKQLSRHRFEESAMELNLPDEISGSLRAVKVEGNVLVDRFKSFQKRNIIETRVRQIPKQKKAKKEIKRRHRDGN